MKLIHKFFFAFFVTNIVLVGLTFIFIYMNFASEFNHFIEQEEQKHVDDVKQQLARLYSELGSWEPVRQNTELWRAIVDPKTMSHDPDILQNNKEINTAGDSGRMVNKHKTSLLLWSNLPADLLQTGKRISLYDQHKKVVVGRTDLTENPHVESVLLNNNVIGWIGLVPSSLVENSSVNAFLSAQFDNYFIITLGVILLAFLMAIVLSRHLSKPIKQIVVATNALSKGQYESRISAIPQDELGTLSKNVNALATTLEQNQQARFQWVSDTSHELRTPLTVLRAHLIAVQDGVFVADANRISVLINQVDILSHIVDDLAQLASSDMANLTYNAVDVDLIQVLKQTIENYVVRFKEHNLTVNTDSLKCTPPCSVRGDKDRLQQLFSNLFENTCRYTDKGGRVNIKLNKVGNELTFIIEDSAPGVLSVDQDKLFERFYRVEKSRSRNYGGSGLGLSLSKKIVEAHGGEISIQNSSLGGLAVKVTFPLQS